MRNTHGYVISGLSVIATVIVLAAGVDSQERTRLAVSLPQEEATCRYIIQHGDTLSQIALQLTGKTEHQREIMRRNHLTSETIYAGDILQIPRQLLLSHQRCAPDSHRSPSDPTVTPTATPASSDSEVLAEIEVIVFEDRNDNREYDAEESGVAGVQVILVRDNNVQPSDEEGVVVFTEIDPGDHAVGLDETTLPEGYQLCTNSTVLLSIAEGDKGYAAFGIQRSTSQEQSD